MGARQHEDGHAQHQDAVFRIAPHWFKIAADDAVVHWCAKQNAHHAGQKRQPHHLENRDIREGVEFPQEHCQRQRHKRPAPEVSVDIGGICCCNTLFNTYDAKCCHKQQNAKQTQVHPRHLPSTDSRLRVFRLTGQRAESFSLSVTLESRRHDIPKADFQFVLHLGFSPFLTG